MKTFLFYIHSNKRERQYSRWIRFHLEVVTHLEEGVDEMWPYRRGPNLNLTTTMGRFAEKVAPPILIINPCMLHL